MTTLGSLFAGVGGFDLGFEAAGYRTLWQVEIDTWCQKVLARHWPDATRHADVTKVTGAELAPVDVITFGSPCQDMSVAGARAGLDGSRSNLFYEATRIIGQMREATDGRLPAWAVWENVPGAFSSTDGSDFAAVLDALAELGAVELEWRVLDARYFGVPQRRRRVFVLTGFHPRGERAHPVLLEPEGRRRRTAPSSQAGQEVAGTLRGGAPGRGWSDDTDRMTFVPLARCVAARGERLDGESDTLLPIGFQSTDGIDFQYCPGFSPTIKVGSGLGISSPPSVAYGFSTKDYGADATEDLMPTLRALGEDCGGGQAGVAYPLAVSENQRAECLLTEYAHDLTTGGGKPGQGYPAVLTEAHPLAMRGRADGAELELGEAGTYNALRAGDGGSSRQNAVLTPTLAVRRLTPRECERLMGWPDDHTRWTADGQEISDSHRYRMCGNGVVAPVAEWIARRICACPCPCHDVIQPGLVPCPSCATQTAHSSRTVPVDEGA